MNRRPSGCPREAVKLPCNMLSLAGLSAPKALNTAISSFVSIVVILCLGHFQTENLFPLFSLEGSLVAVLHDYTFHCIIMQTDGYGSRDLWRLRLRRRRIDSPRRRAPDLRCGLLGRALNGRNPVADRAPQSDGWRSHSRTARAGRSSTDRARLLALPHGASWEIAHHLAEANVSVFDLGSDYRMDTAARYASAYGTPHPLPDQLSEWVYGLPELFGGALGDATRIAVPGCYPTSALLGLGPLLAAGLIEGPIVVDSMSGVTGAGRGPTADLTFGAIDESVRAYRVATHRHRPEIEMGLQLAAGSDVAVQFTPHLVPMQRGILSTCSAGLTGAGSIADALREYYQGSPFVDVIDQPPQTRWVIGSNRALLHAVEDERTGRVIVLVAIDNLGKGAAGQAVQCANLSFHLPEDAGLTAAGWLP